MAKKTQHDARPEWAKLSTGNLIDRMYQLREERLALQKQVAAIKEEEKSIDDYLIENISKNDLQGARGSVAQFNFSALAVPTIEDFPAVCKWQVSRGGVLVLQQRLNEAAVREVWEDGRVVKGVGVFDGIRTSLRKL